MYFCTKCGAQQISEDAPCQHIECDKREPYLLIAHSEESYDSRYEETTGVNHFEVLDSLNEERLIQAWVAQYKMVPAVTIQVFQHGVRVFDGKHPEECFQAIYDKVSVLIAEEKRKEEEKVKAKKKAEEDQKRLQQENADRKLLARLKEKYET